MLFAGRMHIPSSKVNECAGRSYALPVNVRLSAHWPAEMTPFTSTSDLATGVGSGRNRGFSGLGRGRKGLAGGGGRRGLMWR